MMDSGSEFRRGGCLVVVSSRHKLLDLSLVPVLSFSFCFLVLLDTQTRRHSGLMARNRTVVSLLASWPRGTLGRSSLSASRRCHRSVE